MTIPQVLFPVFSKSIIALFISLLLTACSTEENIGSSGAGLVQGATGSAQNVILSWVAPVEREDGAPISMAEIAGYRVYYGTAQDDYTNEVEITDSSTMQATLSGLAPGIYYIVVTTYDMDGTESGHSQVITASV